MATGKAETSVPEAREWRPSRSPWIIAAAIMLAPFMEVLDTSVANVALPHIAGSLSATPEEATWVLTSYLVANAIILPATSWLGRFFGRKRFLFACIALFTLTSGLSGAATSLGMLVAARLLQGAAGGALQPISQAVLLESFPPAKRGQAMAIFGLGVVVAPIIGPTLGGWITDNYTWRWVFYINLPIGALALMMCQAFIEDPPYLKKADRREIDYIGFGLMAVGLAALQMILDRGQQQDWFAALWIRWFAVISAFCLITFIIWELRTKDPVVDLRILTNRNFTVGILLIAIVGMVLYGTIALLPLFLQTLMDYPALQSGMAVSPRGIGALLSIAIAGRLVGKIDDRVMIASSFVLLSYATLLLGKINLGITMSNVTWPNIISGLAMGFLWVPLTTTTMGRLRNEQIGNGTGIFNLMRNLGGSFGIAIVTTMLSRWAQSHQALMVSHLTPYDPTYQQSLHAIGEALAPTLGAAAGQQAPGIIYGILVRQATLWAYVDNFRFLALLALLCVPLAFLFQKVRLRARPGTGVH